MKILISLLILTGCTTNPIQTVSDVCTFGDVQAYQRVTPDERVQFVCK